MRKGEERASRKKKLVAIIIVLNLTSISGIAVELLDEREFYVASGTSMQHGDQPQLSTIDDHDGAIVEPLKEGTRLYTYFEGKERGYKTLGDYGDAVLFTINEGRKRILHRLFCHVQWNYSTPRVTADVFEVGLFGAGLHVFKDYGHDGRDVTVNFTKIYENMQRNDTSVEEGYVTLGDNRRLTDQRYGIPLISRADMIGRAKVINNELTARLPYELALMLALIVGNMVAFAMWFVPKKSKGKLRYDPRMPLVGLFALGASVIAKDAAILFVSEGIDLGGKAVHIAHIAFFALVAIAMGRMASRHLEGEETQLIPVTFWVAFIPLYFIFTWFGPPFVFTFIAFLLLASLYHTRPDVVFEGKNPEDVKERLGGWMFLLFAGTIFLIFVTMVALPFISLLLMGCVIGNAFIAEELFRK